ncbi:hypothetical protein [Streptomyces sp. Ag109_G2-15]|uniref:hypothetical protein n=1 Tax=Streptomyces sp. Ag109_G2-15 TaxID=1938850 RepID=UPI000BC738A3|nr:hypothetical protein [Streptomyces sp. Ag109_G2-15]SOD85036.1 hypothetical protein SAMN06272765_2436 [Streptomyces sp. Ag109_G2-15]
MPFTNPAPPFQTPPFQQPPFQQPPFGQRPNAGGNPVGAVFLGFVVSVVVSGVYSGINLATYKEQSLTVANALYLAHALLNGAIVGCLVGLVGRRSNGARIGAAVIAALGAFFGYTNSLPLIIADAQTPSVVGDLLSDDPFFPAKAWWSSEAHGGVDWYSPLGLVLAAAAAWGLAYVVGNRRQ